MRLKTAPKRKKPQNLNFNQGKHCLGRLSATLVQGGFTGFCFLILPTYRRGGNKTTWSSRVISCSAGRCSDVSVMCHSHSKIKQFIFYTVINLKLNATTWLLYLLVSNGWYVPQIWDPLSHSSYPSNYVAMGDHYSFGNSCGSACVHDHCDIRGHRPAWLFVSCKLLKRQDVMCVEPLGLGDLTHWHISAITAIQHHRTPAVTFCFCLKRLWSSLSAFTNSRNSALAEQYFDWLFLSTTTVFLLFFPYSCSGEKGRA